MRSLSRPDLWALFVIAAGLAFPLVACAQQQEPVSPDSLRRSACERSQKALSAVNVSRHEKSEAIVVMQECGDAGVLTLVTQWRQPAIDTVLLPTLAGVSSQVNDRRVYQAARAVLLDPSRPESVRLAALEVLVTGFNPKVTVSFPTPTKPMYSSYVAIGHVSHPPGRKAPQPVGSEAQEDVLSILRQLAVSDPTERIRKVAAELGPLLKQRSAPK
jgi:hypothetical protein